MSSNPFTLVYDRLFEMTKDNAHLEKFVRSQNYTKLDREGLVKKSIGAADLPELLLTQTSLSGSLIVSSSSAEVNVTYAWLATIGSLDLAYLTSEIQWGLFLVSANCCANLSELTWEEKPFISNVSLGEISLSLDDGEQNRGIYGFSLTWPLVVRMRISRTLLSS